MIRLTVSERPFVGQGYSCSGLPDIHFLSVPSWTRVLANEARGFCCVNNIISMLFMPTVTNTYLTVRVLCTAITDEGSQRLPKQLEIVNLLASMNEPQTHSLSSMTTAIVSKA